MTQQIPMPIKSPRPLKPADVQRYRALMAFQLRAMLLEHDDISAILGFRDRVVCKRYIATGRRVLIDGVIQTVLP
jgi:hypothetical protein